jgi:hypothetical protein
MTLKRCPNRLAVVEISRQHGPSTSVQFPIPERVIICGLKLALSMIVTLPVRRPIAVGVNVTLIVHVALGATFPDALPVGMQVFV